MDSKETNAPQEKEDNSVKHNDKSKNSYPIPKPSKPSNEEIRRQLGWHLK